MVNSNSGIPLLCLSRSLPDFGQKFKDFRRQKTKMVDGVTGNNMSHF